MIREGRESSLWRNCWVEGGAAAFCCLHGRQQLSLQVLFLSLDPPSAYPTPRGVLSPVMKSPGFSKTPAPPRSDTAKITWDSGHLRGLQFVLVGSRLFLLSQPYIHLPFLIAYPMDRKFQPQAQG